MKTNRLSRSLFALALAAIFIATWSCNDEDGPSLQSLRDDRLQFLQDSLRISDSLRLINNAGVVNYAITVVDGSSSSIFAKGSRTEKTQAAITGAVVTISQYGKTLKDTTDDSGMVVFKGFFRSAVNVTVEAAGFTKVSYISALNRKDSTGNGTITFVGNLIPVFATTGTGTATISGRATIQTDLTNKTRELVPDGTTVMASIDASVDSEFSDKFLTTNLEFFHTSSCGCDIVYVGDILQASYQTGVVGTVTAGNYSLTVPAAIDGLPLNLQYSELAADQTLFETTADFGQRTIVQRAVFNDNSDTSTPLAALPTSSSVTVAFESFTTAATATTVISSDAGTIERINVTDGGSGYIAATPPIVEIVPTNPGDPGSGATATATVGANGRVTGITLTSAGSGYSAAAPPTVNIVSGSGATASAALQPNGSVVSIVITNSGFGYTAAPTVTIPASGDTGPGVEVQATGTANIDALGRVVSITITAAGSGYIADPGAITIGAPPAGGVQATADAYYSGQSVNEVLLTSSGVDYTYAPIVTFSAPERAGTRATGTASFDPITRQVTGIQVTNAGSGYTSPPTVTLEAGSGAVAQAFLTGGSLINVNITSQGENYAYPPTVVIGDVTSGGGTGAAGTAIMENGRVVGVNITSAGSGYISNPNISFVSGDNANAFATVSNGVITGITVTDGGRNFAGAPRVLITSANGGGATATATVTGGQITGVTMTTGGTGYLEGNTPAAAERFSAVKGTTLETKPGLTYINDTYFGTGTVRNPN